MPRCNAPKKIFCGTGLPTVICKNQPLVPQLNLGGKACARTAPWFRGQTLLVPGHTGELGLVCTHSIPIRGKQPFQTYCDYSKKKNLI